MFYKRQISDDDNVDSSITGWAKKTRLLYFVHIFALKNWPIFTTFC